MLPGLFPKLTKVDRNREYRRTPKGHAMQLLACLRVRLRKHGMTVEMYNAMLKKQKGVCAVCRTRRAWNRGGSDTLCVDHDHATGKVRGLLCGRCNKMLGAVEEDKQLLRNMIAYLTKHA